MSRAKSLAWPLMTFGIAILVLTASQYLFLYPQVFFEAQDAVYSAHHLGLLIHIAAMVVAATMGPFQFLPGFRARHPKIHRTMGKAYIVGCIIGGFGGMYMALFPRSGFASGSAFFLLGVALVICTYQAYSEIRKHHVQAHREWMTRSFSLIFAAVTLRMWFPTFREFMNEYDAFAIGAWLSWIPNLLVAEWLIRRQRRGGLEPNRIPVIRPTTPIPAP